MKKLIPRLNNNNNRVLFQWISWNSSYSMTKGYHLWDSKPFSSMYAGKESHHYYSSINSPLSLFPDLEDPLVTEDQIQDEKSKKMFYISKSFESPLLYMDPLNDDGNDNSQESDMIIEENESIKLDSVAWSKSFDLPKIDFHELLSKTHKRQQPFNEPMLQKVYYEHIGNKFMPLSSLSRSISISNSDFLETALIASEYEKQSSPIVISLRHKLETLSEKLKSSSVLNSEEIKALLDELEKETKSLIGIFLGYSEFGMMSVSIEILKILTIIKGVIKSFLNIDKNNDTAISIYKMIHLHHIYSISFTLYIKKEAPCLESIYTFSGFKGNLLQTRRSCPEEKDMVNNEILDKASLALWYQYFRNKAYFERIRLEDSFYETLVNEACKREMPVDVLFQLSDFISEELQIRSKLLHQQTLKRKLPISCIRIILHYLNYKKSPLMLSFFKKCENVIKNDVICHKLALLGLIDKNKIEEAIEFYHNSKNQLLNYIHIHELSHSNNNRLKLSCEFGMNFYEHLGHFDVIMIFELLSMNPKEALKKLELVCKNKPSVKYFYFNELLISCLYHHLDYQDVILPIFEMFDVHLKTNWHFLFEEYPMALIHLVFIFAKENQIQQLMELLTAWIEWIENKTRKNETVACIWNSSPALQSYNIFSTPPLQYQNMRLIHSVQLSLSQLPIIPLLLDIIIPILISEKIPALNVFHTGFLSLLDVQFNFSFLNCIPNRLLAQRTAMSVSIECKDALCSLFLNLFKKYHPLLLEFTSFKSYSLINELLLDHHICHPLNERLSRMVYFITASGHEHLLYIYSVKALESLIELIAKSNQLSQESKEEKLVRLYYHLLKKYEEVICDFEKASNEFNSGTSSIYTSVDTKQESLTTILKLEDNNDDQSIHQPPQDPYLQIKSKVSFFPNVPLCLNMIKLSKTSLCYLLDALMRQHHWLDVVYLAPKMMDEYPEMEGLSQRILPIKECLAQKKIIFGQLEPLESLVQYSLNKLPLDVALSDRRSEILTNKIKQVFEKIDSGIALIKHLRDKGSDFWFKIRIELLAQLKEDMERDLVFALWTKLKLSVRLPKPCIKTLDDLNVLNWTKEPSQNFSEGTKTRLPYRSKLWNTTTAITTKFEKKISQIHKDEKTILN